MSELNRYKVSVAALQETKWYGNDVYRVEESIVLAAGLPVPPPGQHLQRGEGVALVLNGRAVRAWREAGEQWKAWSQQLVLARLQTGSRRKDTLHVLSCYAPTRAAHRVEKDKFFQRSTASTVCYTL